SVLDPGGMILIHEFILDNTMDGPLFPALFSLNMLLGTPAGQAYSEKQLLDMLAEAGVGELRRIYFESPNDSSIIAGIVK
ncbi:MAG: SAM-dependent methyltransferase, partial [Candidatus Desulfatibia sp.]